MTVVPRSPRPKKQRDHSQYCGCLVSAAIIVFFFVGLILLSVFEANMRAKAYNRVTGSNITTWEAYWMDTHLLTTPKKEKE